VPVRGVLVGVVVRGHSPMEWLWPIAFDPVLFGEVIIEMGEACDA